MAPEELTTGEGGALRGRLISLGTMGRRLRLLTGLALAQLVAAAALIAIRSVGGATVDVAVRHGFVTVMPSVNFWFCVVFMTLAWGYLLGGALHAHLGVRLAAPAAFTVVMWLTLDRASLDAPQTAIASAAIAA